MHGGECKAITAKVQHQDWVSRNVRARRQTANVTPDAYWPRIIACRCSWYWAGVIWLAMYLWSNCASSCCCSAETGAGGAVYLVSCGTGETGGGRGLLGVCIGASAPGLEFGKGTLACSTGGTIIPPGVTWAGDAGGGGGAEAEYGDDD